MLTNKGFTLIETLFVLFIICMLSTLTLTLHIPKKKIATEIQEIETFLHQAQLKAIVSKQTVTISFTNNVVSSSTLDNTDEFMLSGNEYFDTYQMTYNENGHIKTAKTVTLHTTDKEYRFVFQVGNGCFYVE